MRTITIDIINEKALLLLQNMELLHLIRLRKEEIQTEKTSKWAEFKGAMSKQNIDDINQQLNDLRNEWD